MATLTKEQYEALKRQGRGTYRGQTSSSGQFIIEADKFIGDLQGNADTATRLRDPITISLGGDAEGSAQFAGSSFRLDATIREAEHSVNSDVAENANHSAQASHADLANIATLALRSMLADNASHAEEASHADDSTHADSSDVSTLATRALHADDSTHADNADNATFALKDSNGDNIHNTFVDKQSQITTNTNNIATHEGTLTNHEGRISQAEIDIDDLDTRVSNIETSTDVGQLTQRVVTIEEKNDEQDTRLDAINDTMVTVSTSQYVSGIKRFNQSKVEMSNSPTGIDVTNKDYVDNKTLSSSQWVKDWSKDYTDNRILSSSTYVRDTLKDYTDNKVLSSARYVDDNFVTLSTAQYIRGLKSFNEVLPQSNLIPSNDEDFVNKAYVDDNSGGGSSYELGQIIESNFPLQSPNLLLLGNTLKTLSINGVNGNFVRYMLDKYRNTWKNQDTFIFPKYKTSTYGNFSAVASNIGTPYYISNSFLSVLSNGVLPKMWFDLRIKIPVAQANVLAICASMYYSSSNRNGTYDNNSAFILYEKKIDNKYYLYLHVRSNVTEEITETTYQICELDDSNHVYFLRLGKIVPNYEDLDLDENVPLTDYPDAHIYIERSLDYGATWNRIFITPTAIIKNNTGVTEARTTFDIDEGSYNKFLEEPDIQQADLFLDGSVSSINKVGNTKINRTVTKNILFTVSTSAEDLIATALDEVNCFGRFAFSSDFTKLYLPILYNNHGRLVVSYNGSKQWYRIYEDGWIEQGGWTSPSGTATKTTITLPKEFRTTNYYVSVNFDYYSTSGAAYQYVDASGQTTKSFSVYQHSTSKHTWYACGMGKAYNYDVNASNLTFFYAPKHYFYVVVGDATVKPKQIAVDINQVNNDLNSKLDIDLVNLDLSLLKSKLFAEYDTGWFVPTASQVQNFSIASANFNASSVEDLSNLIISVSIKVTTAGNGYSVGELIHLGYTDVLANSASYDGGLAITFTSTTSMKIQQGNGNIIYVKGTGGYGILERTKVQMNVHLLQIK